MVKKARDPRVEEMRGADMISTENHMEVFRRLAKITNMHNPPSPRPGEKRK